jgi:hypothetical protein
MKVAMLAMRGFAALLCLAMLAAVAVQYNDPDGPLWMLYYGVPAFWAALAAWQPARLNQTPAWTRALWASVLFSAGLMIFYWPTMPGFWRKEVWWVEETAREGMGLMIAFAVMVVVAAMSRLKPQRA